LWRLLINPFDASRERTSDQDFRRTNVLAYDAEVAGAIEVHKQSAFVASGEENSALFLFGRFLRRWL
jgi:hypothetical protein